MADYKRFHCVCILSVLAYYLKESEVSRVVGIYDKMVTAFQALEYEINGIGSVKA
jgi:hypothetical protein